MKKIFSFLLTVLITQPFFIRAQAQECDLPTMNQKLEKALIEDQEARNELMPLVAEYQKTGDGVLKLLLKKRKVDKVDKKNQELVYNLTKSCGWPDELSENAHKAIFMVIQHAELEDFKNFIDQVEEKVEKNLLSPSDHATMADRIAMHEGRAQKFGTQTFQTPNSVNTVWPVINSDSLDVWRSSVGLPSMQVYFDIALDSMGVEMAFDSTLTLEQANSLRNN